MNNEDHDIIDDQASNELKAAQKLRFCIVSQPFSLEAFDGICLLHRAKANTYIFPWFNFF